MVQRREARRLEVDLEAESVLNEEIFVTATRSDVRIEDEPLRVEVVDREEIDEKAVKRFNLPQARFDLRRDLFQPPEGAQMRLL